MSRARMGTMVLAFCGTASFGCTPVIEKPPTGSEKIQATSPEEIQKEIERSLKHLPTNRDGVRVDGAAHFNPNNAAGNPATANSESK